jgi:hypothetical protein
VRAKAHLTPPNPLATPAMASTTPPPSPALGATPVQQATNLAAPSSPLSAPTDIVPTKQSAHPRSPQSATPLPALSLGVVSSTFPRIASSSPASSQEKLDWGSIDEEDGALALHNSMREEAVWARECSSARVADAAGATVSLMLLQGESSDGHN